MMPERIDRIVLVNGMSIRREGGLMLVPADLEEGRELFESLRDPSADPIPDFVIADYVQNAPTSPIGRLSDEIEDLESHLMDGRLHEVTIPIDIMWGASDMLVPVEYARKLRAELPNARLTLVPECGHHPANECPVEFAPLLEDVLEKEPPVAVAGEEP
jgi:pimeloyl-ACP methyl ester carboxylesterase